MGTLRTGDGRTLTYRESGHGPLLVCHPGGPGFSSLYLQDLGGLGDEFSLIMLDPRGTGGSERPSDSRAYRTREEEELWKQRDPIFILRDRLIDAKALTMDEYTAMEKDSDTYIENEVIKFAEESPEPNVADLEKYVLA